MNDEHSEESAGSDDDGDLCTRCDGRLIFLGVRDFHEGTRAWGFALGDVGELFTAGTEMEMYACDSCGHVEFFLPQK